MFYNLKINCLLIKHEIFWQNIEKGKLMEYSCSKLAKKEVKKCLASKFVVSLLQNSIVNLQFEMKVIGYC